MDEIGRAMPGIRMRIDEIPDFPECDIQAELYDLKAADKINQLYAKMAGYLAELKEHSKYDKDSEHPLTKRLRAREEIELLKVPLAAELARDAIEKRFSVAIFLNFASSLKALSHALGTNCIIDGSVTGAQRDRNIGDFQENKERAILVNIKAGGVSMSLPDLDGEHPRLGLAMPTDSAVDMLQVFGRLPRHGGKSKSHYRVLLAAGTCETKTYDAFQTKAGNLAALNDGDLRPELDN